MVIRKLTRENLNQRIFHRMVELEENCGLEPYNPGMLLECVFSLDTFGCFENDVLAGFVTMMENSRYLAGSLYLVNINVARESRGKGLAKHLLLAACRHYGTRDRWITLDVSRDNPAKKLYERLGFRVTSFASTNGKTDVVLAVRKELLERNLENLLK